MAVLLPIKKWGAYLVGRHFHPLYDDQSEIVNKSLEGYLRCMTGKKPKEWLHCLALAEWWYNSSYHSSKQATPYKVVHGQPPPIHLP